MKRSLTYYYGADIVLFVSLYEGFGLPILEAQAVGRPIVTVAGTPCDRLQVKERFW